MAAPGSHAITEHLHAWRRGDEDAVRHLMPLVYEELRRMAHQQLQHERPGHTLDTSALVHEAYDRLRRLHCIDWVDRAHFLAIAARAMRRVLINHAEARRTQKRGSGVPPIPLEEIQVAAPGREVSFEGLLALDHALQTLATRDARQARVVECRFFGGLTIPETAETLGISPATVKRDWEHARAWLNRELSR
ncbi:MAG: sigma-70 family RNA polymerase sigma factor [Bacteroidota bacterium]